ncbi:TetR/AcrR family transcriptional regulator [Sutcliffiella horikoshii]|uniref:TetR/AcrR family transcriptional regulator n=1 Tax=Sutcliffiella horikoshii TaxID=79883 RepID=UPI0007D047E8|nr:TetR-like C-terminal domain-containing protein [Sutcliffiella horikoshii]MCM3618536.1 TetR/AcrR family transcriptional regulator [Sutcliffiella horikoshii]
MSEKMDRRKQYTRMVLKESLLDLLKDKSIASITIKEICTKADINRSTFYAHYSSQYDLLDSIDDEFTEDMVKTLNQYNFSKEDEAYQMTEKIFEYIASKSDICCILLSENTEVQFQKKGMMIAKEYILKSFIPNKQVDAETFEYLSIFFVSGSIYMIKNWLESGMNKTPKEMAGLLNDFLNRGLRGQAR